MSVDDALKRVPYWRALSIALLGAAGILWLQSAVAKAVSEDNIRDDATYPTKVELHETTMRLVRIEEKVDLLLRR